MNATLRNKLAPAGILGALLAGPPFLLSALVGWPLPNTETLREAIDLHWISPTLAQHLGATVAWATWLYISACILAAAIAQTRSKPARLPLPHTLAGYINATVALLLVGSSIAGRHAALPAAAPMSMTTSLPTAVGTVLQAPVATTGTYEVRPRDTLWDIAANRLGDPLRWREIWRLNAGHEMVDGATFHDPNLIRPGWQLDMPHGPPSAQAAVVMPAAPQHAVAPAHHEEAQPEPQVAPPADAITPTHRPPAGARPAAASHAAAEHPSPLPIGLGLGAGAAGILALLVRRRRAAMRRRPVGQRVPLPTGELAAAERALSNSNNLDAAHALAGTLRLASALTRSETDVILELAISRADGVELQFRGDVTLPEPFVATDHGYLLPREHFAATYAAHDVADPAPALAHIGDDERGAIYVNLEALGAVAIDGTKEARDELVRRLLISLGASPWTALTETRFTDPRHVGADLVGKANRVDLDEELTRLTALANQTRRAVTEADAPSLAAMRWRTEPPDGVSLVIASPTAPGLEALLALAADPCTAVVAVLTDAHGDIPTVTITDDGLRLPDHSTLTARPIEPACVEAVRELIDLTAAPYVETDAAPYADVHEQAPLWAEPGEVVVRVLGPLEIDGPVPHLAPQLRDIVLYLALHRRGVSLGEMATALWPEQLRSEKTLRNRMHELRRAIGGRVSLGPGWRLDDSITTDWAQFQALARGTLNDRGRALELVRGQPLQDVKGDWSSLEGFESEMEASIVDLAIEVSEKLLAESEPEQAMTAARAGMKACPWDERLYQLAMRSAADRGAIGEVKTLYAELRAILDIEDDAEPDPETEAIYRELLQAARRTANSPSRE